MTALITSDVCIGCGACVDVCPFDAIQMTDEKAVVIKENCSGCGVCADACAVDAIQIQ